jgi:uncharacterized membrane protein YoaK (UPF0700 family)
MLAIDATEWLLGWFDRSETSKAAQAGREFVAVLPLWLGFFAGTAIAAIAYITIGLPCVVLAILPVGGLALWYARPHRA